MATSEQLALRRDRIVEWIGEIRNAKDIDTLLGKIPKNLKVPVLAGALAEGLITAKQIEPRCAHDVALNFLKEAPWRERDAAADKGTDGHTLFEAIGNGEKVDIPDHLANHVTSFMQFCNEYEMEFIKTEFSVFSPTYEYAGTGDFLGYSGRRPEWGLICGDYKTSKSGIWPSVALQLAALKYADFIGLPDGTEDRTTLPEIQTCIGVQITEDGYRVVPVRATEGTFQVFLSAVNVARWKREYEQFALDQSLPFVPRKETA